MERTRLEGEGPAVEVQEKPVRRRFSAEYKLRILTEADGCTELGQRGELLRREGLYSSLLSTWRRQRDEGVLAGLASKRRGRKAKPKTRIRWRMRTHVCSVRMTDSRRSSDRRS